jgi:hypothetical protein
MMGYAVFAGCTYESVALVSRARIPTITRIVHRHRHVPGVELGVWAGVYWLAWHLLFEGRRPK